MAAKKPVFLGIDLGTTGMRAIAADDSGTIHSVKTVDVSDSTVAVDDELRSEQDPSVWRSALFAVLDETLPALDRFELRGIAVDSTSGTVLAVDGEGNPLSHAFMHNDVRGEEESHLIAEKTGIAVKPSFALSKIYWIRRHEPSLYERTRTFLHAADYLQGLLSGDFATSDFSNAVKTGYDLANDRWPESIASALDISLDKLPRVVKTADVVGVLRKDLAERYGLGEVRIVAGATDSTTSFYSSGAEKVGDWNTTLGTVAAIRGVAEEFIRDPEGLLYAHRHPEGYWLPGAASNTGGEAIRAFFGDKLKEYDGRIEGTPPTGGLVYPLLRKSEKFPFMNSRARGFIDMQIADPSVLFKAFLEGVSYVERMMYERIVDIGYALGDTVFSMGGGAYSTPWMHIRANVLGRRICRAREVETAFGAAIIAAGGVHYRSLTAAIDTMVNIDRVVEPEEGERKTYDDLYERFVEECVRRGLFRR
jgi:sugar (pentulose or hexulose) kinase